MLQHIFYTRDIMLDILYITICIEFFLFYFYVLLVWLITLYFIFLFIIIMYLFLYFFLWGVGWKIFFTILLYLYPVIIIKVQ